MRSDQLWMAVIVSARLIPGFCWRMKSTDARTSSASMRISVFLKRGAISVPTAGVGFVVMFGLVFYFEVIK